MRFCMLDAVATRVLSSRHTDTATSPAEGVAAAVSTSECDCAPLLLLQRQDCSDRESRKCAWLLVDCDTNATVAADVAGHACRLDGL